MMKLGRLYDRGEGVGQNFAKAAGPFERAMLARDTAEALRLGHMFRRGIGARQNVTNAVAIYETALSDGRYHAANFLVDLYLNVECSVGDTSAVFCIREREVDLCEEA